MPHGTTSKTPKTTGRKNNEKTESSTIVTQKKQKTMECSPKKNKMRFKMKPLSHIARNVGLIHWEQKRLGVKMEMHLQRWENKGGKNK